MSNSVLYNLYEDEIPNMEASAKNWKRTFDYRVQTDDNNYTMFLKPPTQWDIADARGKAKNNSRRLVVQNRLAKKIAIRQMMLADKQGSEIESKK